MSRIAMFFIVMFLTGCSPEQHSLLSSEIYGLYKARYNDGVDILEINKNGYYRHEYYINNHKEEDVGTWRFVNSNAESKKSVDLLLLQFVFRKSQNLLREKSDFFVRAEKSGRLSLSNNKEAEVRIRLCFNYDLDYCFVKTD